MVLEKEGDKREGMETLCQPYSDSYSHPQSIPLPINSFIIPNSQLRKRLGEKKIDYLKGLVIISYLLRSLASSSLTSLPLTPNQTIWSP